MAKDKRPVGADVEGDWQSLVGRDAGQRGVEGQLTHGYTHALGTKVSKTWK